MGAELLAGQVRAGQAPGGQVPGGQSRAWLWGTVALSAGAFSGAVVLAPPASAAPIRGLAWLLFLGSSVHVAATGWLYTLPDVRAHVAARPVRYAWIPAGLVVAGAVTAAAAVPGGHGLASPGLLRLAVLSLPEAEPGPGGPRRLSPPGPAPGPGRTPGPDGSGRGRHPRPARPSQPSPAWGAPSSRGPVHRGGAVVRRRSRIRGGGPDPPACCRPPGRVLCHVPDGAAVLAAHLCLPVALRGGGRHDHRPRVPVPAPGGPGGRGEPPGDIPLAPAGRVRQRRPGGRSAAQRRVASARVPARDPADLRCLSRGGDGALRDRRWILADA